MLEASLVGGWPRVGQNERSERVDVLVRLIKRDNLYNPSLSDFWVVRKKGKGYGVAVCFIFLFLLKSCSRSLYSSVEFEVLNHAFPFEAHGPLIHFSRGISEEI